MPQEHFLFGMTSLGPPGALLAFLGPFPARQTAFLARVETVSAGPPVLFPGNIS